MRTLAAGLAAGAVLVAAMAPQAARAEFGLVPGSFNVSTLDARGQPELRAGAHPDRFVTTFEFLTGGGGGDANVKDVVFDLPAGFTGDATAVPTCPRSVLITPGCPPESRIGVMRLTFLNAGGFEIPIYNVVPEEGEVAEFSGVVFIVPLRFIASLRADDDLGTRIELRNLPQNLPLLGGEVEFWGVPADHQTNTTILRQPFLTNATRCEGLPTTTIRVRSWQQPESWISATSAAPGPLTGCEDLPFDPGLGLTLESPAADSPTGALIELTLPQSDDASGRATSHLREAAVTLPDGMSLSPTVAEGLTACDDEFAAEIANKTMHGVMHIGAVEDEVGSFRAQMAVLVKPNGRFGNAYMAAIRPFRHLIVYPAVMRQGQELWERSGGSVARDSEGS